MGKLVKLSLDGQLESGYQVKVELLEIKKNDRDGRTLVEGVFGSLPPAASVYSCYRAWQQKYNDLDHLGVVSRLTKKQGSQKLPTEISIESGQEAADRLKQKFNDWLDARGFRKIENTVRNHLNVNDVNEDIRFLIKTGDDCLWQLPWSEWNLFKDYRKAEVAFSPLEFDRVERNISGAPKEKVRILAIAGDTTGIDCQPDRENLKRLRSAGAEPEFLNQPSLKKVRDALWMKKWDILFYAGHSEREKIHLNQADDLILDDLDNTIKNAVERGLKLVILNSCNGLDLARRLVTEFGVPLVIAMREPVPDRVAQQFLEYFLLAYAYQKQPLYVAVRQARQRIADEWRERLPSIDWLPTICQNPGIRPPTWTDLIRPIDMKKVGIASAAAALFVVGIRFLGLLQPLELGAFDRLMRMRPAEPPDDRFLVVTVDDEDIQYQLNKNMPLTGSLADTAFAQMLEKFAPHQPRLVGLDIYHDFPFEPKLANALENLQHFIAICKIGQTQYDSTSTPPPPNLPKESLGFSDLPSDSDYIIRRQILGMTSSDRCNASRSFSLQVALLYLEGEKIGFGLKRLAEGSLRIGSTIFKRLEPNAGGYQFKPQETMGYQIMLNYRSAPPETVKLSKILNGSMDRDLPQLVANRIVLIGVMKQQDKHFTPYSTGLWPERMPGILVQAQMASQIISAVLDDRPLLWWWPEWGEVLWVASWSLAGGIVVWLGRSPRNQAIAGVIAIASLYGLCFVLLLAGGWVPLVPAALAFAIASSSAIAYGKFSTYKT